MSRTLPQWPVSAVLVGLAALIFSGCQQDEEVRRYRVPKPLTFPEPPPKVRMLAVILPHGERTWFFKLTGPTAVVNEQAEAFDRFIRSVTFTSNKENPVEWAVPEGWQKEKDRPGRQATFHMGPKDDPAEMTVVALGAQAGSLLANVNRWRGQIGLKSTDENGLEKATRPVEIKGIKGTRVDLSGPGGKSGMGMGK